MRREKKIPILTEKKKEIWKRRRAVCGLKRDGVRDGWAGGAGESLADLLHAGSGTWMEEGTVAEVPFFFPFHGLFAFADCGAQTPSPS